MFGWSVAHGYAGREVAGRSRSGARRERSSELRCKATVVGVVRVNGTEVNREGTAIVERAQDGLRRLPRLRPIGGAACSRHVLRAMSALGHMARWLRVPGLAARAVARFKSACTRVPAVCQYCDRSVVETIERRQIVAETDRSKWMRLAV